MLHELKVMMRALLEDDEFFELGAKMVRKTHQALVEAGFTEDQATKIVAGKGGAIGLNK